MSLTYAQKMALGAKRATYRRRLQEVLDAQGLSGAALARQLGISDVPCTGRCRENCTAPPYWTGCVPTARRKNIFVIPAFLTSRRTICRGLHRNHLQRARPGPPAGRL